jgi:hypothetical protein
VVTGARGNDAAVAGFRIERRHLVGSAANLEGAGALQALRLEEDAAAKAVRERLRGKHGCSAGDAVDGFGGPLNIGQGDHRLA